MKATIPSKADQKADLKYLSRTYTVYPQSKVRISADLAILGAGASGLALAWILIHEENYKGDIVLVDKSINSLQDSEKLWCFWEYDVLPESIEAISCHSWTSALVRFGAEEYHHSLSRYSYRCIRSSDYRAHMKKELSKYPNVQFIADRYLDVCSPLDQQELHRVECKNHIVESKKLVHSFSGSPELAHQPMNAGLSGDQQSGSHPTVRQQFIGWEIETVKELFNPDRFTFMDFDLNGGSQIIFNYNLPFSTTHALIERTFLDRRYIPAEQIEAGLHEYIQKRLCIDTSEYRIVRRESGSIPLIQTEPPAGSSLPIGQAAGVTRPSTGYTFIRSWRHARQTARYISGSSPKLPRKLDPKRQHILDYFFLKELKHNPDQILRLFKGMLTGSSLDTVFEFMAGTTHFGQDLTLIRKLPVLHFLKSVFEELFNRHQTH